jgi:hypothetical protein
MVTCAECPLNDPIIGRITNREQYRCRCELRRLFPATGPSPAEVAARMFDERIEFSPETLRAAETCEHRKLETLSGCCGPVYVCLGGRHDSQRVDFLRFCAQCIESDPL